MQSNNAECTQENAPPLGRCKLPVQHRHASSRQAMYGLFHFRLALVVRPETQMLKTAVEFCNDLAVNNLHHYHQKHLRTVYQTWLIKTKNDTQQC